VDCLRQADIARPGSDRLQVLKTDPPTALGSQQRGLVFCVCSKYRLRVAPKLSRQITVLKERDRKGGWEWGGGDYTHGWACLKSASAVTMCYIRAYVRAYVRACVRACVRMCVRACMPMSVRACVRACMCVVLVRGFHLQNQDITAT